MIYWSTTFFEQTATTGLDGKDDICKVKFDANSIDHIAIAVQDIDMSLRVYSNALGFEITGQETLDSENVKVSFLDCKGCRIELLEPLSEEGHISKFLRDKKGGVHHICFSVEDIGESIESCRREGMNFIEPAPREGSEGKKVAFIHPESSDGVLIELREK